MEHNGEKRQGIRGLKTIEIVIYQFYEYKSDRF